MAYTIDEKMAQTYVHEEQANTLAARDYKQPQTVVTMWDGTDVCPTLSCSNAGGGRECQTNRTSTV